MKKKEITQNKNAVLDLLCQVIGQIMLPLDKTTVCHTGTR